jgi:hypothetical protein
VSGGRRGFVALLVVVLAAAGACSSGDDEGEGSSTTTTAVLEDAVRGTCDDLTPDHCLLPWPNDRFTVPDGSTPTGVRLLIPADGTPHNVDDVPVDVTDQNRADGFSPASTILTWAPEVDVEASGLAPSTDIGASLDDDAPIRLTDLTTGDRWPYWAELDAPAPEGEQLLMVHPAVALTEAHQYEVAVDGLVDADGEPLADDLQRTWTFTVASADSLSGRLRSMIQETGDTTPAFEVTSTTRSNPVVVEGTYEIPNFLDNDGSSGGRFDIGEDGMPSVNPDHPTARAPFTCILGDDPGAQTVVYGHGLLGSREEVLSLADITNLGGLNACATDWIGMASEDLGTVTTILQDVSAFPEQADRLQQGHVAFSLLGRLVNRPDGFASDPAFQAAGGASLLGEDGAVFVGNSQGGILGGAVSAVTDEWERVVLGVPGIGYNLLLPRSVDWPEFQAVFDPAYPDPVDRLIVLELIQLLWDSGENSAYAQHLTDDPYDGVPAKTVLLVEAFGDHQVANVSTEILARTIGAQVHLPALEDGRSHSVEPFFGIDPLPSFPATTSVLSVWDYGTPPPPDVNLPPVEPDYGEDPHGAGSSEPGVLTQALTFLTTGQITDTCSGQPCRGRQIDQE